MFKMQYDEFGWYQKVDYSKFNNVLNQINIRYEHEYIGHGGSCIAFKKEGDVNVNKVCLKKDLAMTSGQTFTAYTKFLIENEIKILPCIDIIYEDDNFFVYTQSFCQPIYVENLNTLVFSKILKFIYTLIEKKIKITDLFHKNFGLYNNDVYLYDYHDHEDFDSKNRFYIAHIAQLFSLYYRKEYLCDYHLDAEMLEELNFGEDKLPSDAVELIKVLYNYNFDGALLALANIIKNLESKIIKSFDDYQHYDIDGNGVIHLRSHTLNKFDIFTKIPTNKGDHVIDYGCSLGGIGMKIAETYPDLKVTLNNITKSELEICRNNIINSCLTNINVSEQNIIDDHNTYDICLYFAILHHILKFHDIDYVIDMIYNQIRKYAVIELPFGNDFLLKKVIECSNLDYNKTYVYLESPEIFSRKIEKYFKIELIQKIEYEMNNINRYAFILRKI